MALLAAVIGATVVYLAPAELRIMTGRDVDLPAVAAVLAMTLLGWVFELGRDPWPVWLGFHLVVGVATYSLMVITHTGGLLTPDQSGFFTLVAVTVFYVASFFVAAGLRLGVTRLREAMRST